MGHAPREAYQVTLCDVCLLETRERKFNMKHLVLMILLGLLPGLANATFELADPAEQILEEQQEPDYGETGHALGENDFCIFEVDNGECFCIHKETKERILLEDEACVEIVTRVEIIEPE